MLSIAAVKKNDESHKDHEDRKTSYAHHSCHEDRIPELYTKPFHPAYAVAFQTPNHILQLTKCLLDEAWADRSGKILKVFAPLAKVAFQ